MLAVLNWCLQKRFKLRFQLHNLTMNNCQADNFHVNTCVRSALWHTPEAKNLEWNWKLHTCFRWNHLDYRLINLHNCNLLFRLLLSSRSIFFFSLFVIHSFKCECLLLFYFSFYFIVEIKCIRTMHITLTESSR